MDPNRPPLPSLTGIPPHGAPAPMSPADAAGAAGAQRPNPFAAGLPTGVPAVREIGAVDPLVAAAIEEQRAREQARNPRLLSQTFDRWSSAASAGGMGAARPLPRRFATFTIDASVCVPGVFAEDFDLTLGSLTPELELQAAAKSGGDPVGMAFHMARLAMVAVNGEPIGPGADDFLWSALGTGGRQLVTGMFAKLTGDEGAQGKALATLRVH